MKLITVMIGSVIILRKSYAWMEYLAAGLLVGRYIACLLIYITVFKSVLSLTDEFQLYSACLFSLGDVAVAPEYSGVGIVIVLVSLIADALHSNTQVT
jgi:hypothetical protein